MPRLSPLFLSLTILCCLCAVSQAAVRDIIPAGTILHCTVNETNFSSKTAMVGDPILCHLGPVGAFGHSVLPRGAELGGHLEDVKNPGHFVGKGWMQLTFDRLILPGAQILPLEAKEVPSPHLKVDAEGKIRGKGHAVRDTVEWMIPVLWPIKVLMLPARGPYPALKGETRLSMRLMEDIEIPYPMAARNSIPMPPWASGNQYHPTSSQGDYRNSQGPGLQTAVYSDRPLTQGTGRNASSAQLTVVVFKGGAAFMARDYWLQGGQLHCVSENGENQMFPLEKMDLDRTVSVNRQRNVDIVLQTREYAEQ